MSEIMIISHKYRFIFIKTVKTASTSIEVYLSDKCGDEDVFTPIHPSVSPHRARNYAGFYNHMPSCELKTMLADEVWDGYFKFCVERNPWDKVLSLFHMLNYRSGFELSFDQFLSEENRELEKTLNYPRYMDAAGKALIVDRVIRYENLDQELGEVFERLDIPYEGSLNVYAKTEMRTEDRLPYNEVYTDSQRHLVQRLFRKEIDLHGYVF
ncbi:MAG: hypothetical protein ACE5FQ_13270 [Thiogranum sp.]